ncbi:18002_t:CDS:2, partial [Acaulospora morrowiae]
GQAFAVLFTAQGQERYATLGPSFIVTSNSDPNSQPPLRAGELESHSEKENNAMKRTNGNNWVHVLCIFRAKLPMKRMTSARGMNNNNMMTMASVPSEHGDPLFRNTKNKIVSLSNKNRKSNSARNIWA